MPNPLFNQLGGQNPMRSMLSQFNQFKQMFNGDPKQIVQTMLQNGNMSQTQFQQYSQMENELRTLIK